MAELTWWSFLAFGMLPLPVVLITILSSPAPRDVRKGVLWFVQQVLSFEMRKPFLVMHVALLLTGASLAVSLSKAVSYQQEVSLLADKRDPNILVMLLGKKFRAERNCWLSAFAFFAWAMLLVTHRVNKEKHELRGRLLALQGKGAEAAQEVGFLGAKREQEMRELGRQAPGDVAAAAKKLTPAGAAAGPSSKKEM